MSYQSTHNTGGTTMGADKEGFFTSDFNEAAGLPKDYKIYADGLNNFVNNFIKRQPFYSQIDIAKK